MWLMPAICQLASPYLYVPIPHTAVFYDTLHSENTISTLCWKLLAAIYYLCIAGTKFIAFLPLPAAFL
jgi:hypothetical protein